MQFDLTESEDLQATARPRQQLGAGGDGAGGDDLGGLTAAGSGVVGELCVKTEAAAPQRLGSRQLQTQGRGGGEQGAEGVPVGEFQSQGGQVFAQRQRQSMPRAETSLERIEGTGLGGKGALKGGGRGEHSRSVL